MKLVRVWSAATLFAVCACVSVAVDARGYTVTLLGVAVLAALIGPRVRVEVPTQRILLMMAGVVGAAVGLFVPPPVEEGPLRAGMAATVTALAMAQALRQVFVGPEGGGRFDFFLGVLALILSRQGRIAGWFPFAAFGYLGLVLAQLRAEDPGRVALARVPRREVLIGALTLVLASGVGIGMAVGLPRLNHWITMRAMEAYLDDNPTSGFDDRFELGSITSLQDSTTIALRLRGPAPEHLRGAVWNVYAHGRWRRRATLPPPRSMSVRTEAPTERGTVTVERTLSTGDFYFTPLTLAAFGTDEGTARVDIFGVLRAIPGDPGSHWWFRVGDRTVSPPQTPSDHDRQLPRRDAAFVAYLQRTAAEWGEGHARADVRIARIADRLRRDYRYARSFSRSPGVDPVFDFLTTHRAGHCEYFASALALLGRAAGVPTRVVGGYRVAEENPITHEWIVRERNAHAWVEAYTEQGWTTWDATPDNELPFNRPNQTSRLRAFFESGSALFAMARDWLYGRNAGELLAAAGVMLGVWLAIRARRNRGVSSTTTTVVDDAPFPAMTALEAKMDAMGLGRAKAESLEAWSTRVRATGRLSETQTRALEAAIRGFAAWRYGEVGRAEDVTAALAAAVSSLRPGDGRARSESTPH